MLSTSLPVLVADFGRTEGQIAISGDSLSFDGRTDTIKTDHYRRLFINSLTVLGAPLVS